MGIVDLCMQIRKKKNNNANHSTKILSLLCHCVSVKNFLFKENVILIRDSSNIFFFFYFVFELGIMPNFYLEFDQLVLIDGANCLFFCFFFYKTVHIVWKEDLCIFLGVQYLYPHFCTVRPWGDFSYFTFFFLNCTNFLCKEKNGYQQCYVW